MCHELICNGVKCPAAVCDMRELNSGRVVHDFVSSTLRTRAELEDSGTGFGCGGIYVALIRMRVRIRDQQPGVNEGVHSRNVERAPARMKSAMYERPQRCRTRLK